MLLFDKIHILCIDTTEQVTNTKDKNLEQIVPIL